VACPLNANAFHAPYTLLGDEPSRQIVSAQKQILTTICGKKLET
jgi:hypothetical protein